jgi:hypothetical protein
MGLTPARGVIAPSRPCLRATTMPVGEQLHQLLHGVESVMRTPDLREAQDCHALPALICGLCHAKCARGYVFLAYFSNRGDIASLHMHAARVPSFAELP